MEFKLYGPPWTARLGRIMSVATGRRHKRERVFVLVAPVVNTARCDEVGDSDFHAL